MVAQWENKTAATLVEKWDGAKVVKMVRRWAVS